MRGLMKSSEEGFCDFNKIIPGQLTIDSNFFSFIRNRNQGHSDVPCL
jgi:hypothetical protein